jgi:hypothetical protein
MHSQLEEETNQLNPWRHAPPLTNKVGQPHLTRPWWEFSNVGFNQIGDKGCKYLTKTHMHNLKEMLLRTIFINKMAMISEMRGCCTSQRELGKNCRRYIYRLDLGNSEETRWEWEDIIIWWEAIGGAYKCWVWVII